MLLLLSGRSPANSTYATETGQILYKVNKPIIGPATIRKAVSTVQGVWQGESAIYELPADQRIAGGNSTTSEAEGQVVDEADNDPLNSSTEGPRFEGHFAFFAQVEFNAFAKSKFRYNSLDVPVQTYLRRVGRSWVGRHRVFKANDRQGYRWERRVGRSYVLFKDDGSQTQVGKYTHSRPNLGPLLNGRQGSLDIVSSCEPILDEIIMTLVYMFVVDSD